MDLLTCSHLWQAPITSRLILATQKLVSCVPRPGFSMQRCKTAANFNARLLMFPNEKKKKISIKHQGTPGRNQRVWIPAFLCCAEHHPGALLQCFTMPSHFTTSGTQAPQQLEFLQFPSSLDNRKENKQNLHQD